MNTVGDQLPLVNDRLDTALTELQSSGVLSQDQRDAVVAAYLAAPPEQASGGQSPPLGASVASAAPWGEGRLRARLFEAAGYLGGILVGASILALLGQYWDDLTTTGHVVTLTALGVLAWIPLEWRSHEPQVVVVRDC